MRRRLLLLAIIATSFTGCKLGERRNDPEPPFGNRPSGDFSSRTRDHRDRETPDKPAGHWVEGPYAAQPPRGNAPAADSYTDPSDPTFDTKTETRGVIAGYVIDPEGRKAGKLFVQVEPLPSDGSGAPLEVETLADGSFLMKGLQAGRSYRLTTRATDGTRVLAGRTYTKAPNVHVKLTLIEGLTLDDVKPATGGAPARAGVVTPLPEPDLSSRGRDPRPAPIPVSPEREFTPTGGDLPNTGGGWSPTSPGGPAPTLGRPDLSTGGPSPDWKPPVTTIPRSGGLLEPPPLVPLPSPGRSRSQVVRSGNQFTLADGLGRSRTFPSGREGDLLLIEFMTSSCIPCKQAAPGLNDLQRKYGAKGLEVIAVACDDEPYPTRVAVAERYRNDMNLLFGVYTETGKRPGELLKKFGVDRYPTAVLLDASGAVLWQGHPGKKETLIPTIEEALRQPAR